MSLPVQLAQPAVDYFARSMFEVLSEWLAEHTAGIALDWLPADDVWQVSISNPGGSVYAQERTLFDAFRAAIRAAEEADL